MIKLFFSMLLFASCHCFAQTNYHVKTTGDDSNDGLSWNTAFATIQKALSVATHYGDEIYVAKGTYYPDEGPGQTNDDRNSCFILNGNYVRMLGGFEGVQGQYTRNWVTNPTILSGEIQQDGERSNNTYHVMVFKEINPGWVLDGFTIKQGYANGAESEQKCGGGIFNNQTFLTANGATRIVLRNCFFSDNYASNGGGIYNESFSIGEINNCRFTNNTASQGGGIMNYIGYSKKIELCQFENNSGGEGAAVYNRAASPLISNCYFANNPGNSCIYNITQGAPLPGVIEVCTPTIINCSISNSGVAIENIGLLVGALTKPNIINCTLSGTYYAMYNNVHGDFDVKNSIIWGIVTNSTQQYIHGAPLFSYCIVKDGFSGNTWNTSVGVDGGNNSSADPKFVDPLNNNLRLKCSSPAIDAGDNSANTTGLDLEANLRIINDVIDMGAYESLYGKDETAPEAHTKNITVALDVNGLVTITGSSVNNNSTDNCEIGSMSVSPSSFNCNNIGQNTVIFTVTDANGNSSTASAVVTVIDNTPPTANCQNITVNLDANGNASITASQINNNSTDACGIKSLVASKTSFNCSNVGANNVVFTVTDNNDNQSTCTAVVTVVDNTPPDAKCKNIQVVLNASGNASITAAQVDNGSTDACGIKSRTLSQSNFDCSNLGANTVVLTVTDNNDNQSTSNATVTIIDNIVPVISNVSATPDVLSPSNHQMRDVTINYIPRDNCPVTSTLSVTSNEPINGTADGDTSPDWIIVDDHHVQLRAERAANGNGRTYTITITVSDAAGNTATSSVIVTVTHNITKPNSGQTLTVGSTFGFEGEFWDKPENRHTAKWLIDGSTSVKGTVTEPSGNKNGKVTGSYKFSTAGVYKLQMNTTDQNGITNYANTNGDIEEIIVIYDPNGGYAYGGGYFNSPVGSLVTNPSATGKVSYGFAMNYFKSATLPKGETQFEFKIGNFEYNAVNFDYLSISGSKAQFKGTGKIVGGQSGIDFIMTVIDGDLDGTGVDKVRMKIYNKNTGQIYYDNQPGASDAANPTTAVGLNSSVVIQNTINTITQKSVSNEEVKELEVRAIPNPSNNNFTVNVRSNNMRDKIVLQVIDLYGRIIEVRNVAAEQTIKLGDNYRPGTYFVKFIQATEHKEIKLIKLPN